MSRLQLTEEEDKFYRSLLFTVTSDPVIGQPFLTKAFQRLVPVSTEDAPTMSVDEYWRVYINFPAMMKRGRAGAAMVLNHEVWHLLRRHAERLNVLEAAPAGFLKHRIGNLAADLEINDDIKELIPSDALLPEHAPFLEYAEGRTLEQYYTQMLDDVERLKEFFPDIEQDLTPRTSEDEDDSEGGCDDDASQDAEESDESASDDAEGQDASSDAPEASESASDASDGSESESDPEDTGESEGEGSGGDSEEDDTGSDEAGDSSGDGDTGEDAGDSEGEGQERESDEDGGQRPSCGSGAGGDRALYELPPEADEDSLTNPVELEKLIEAVAEDIREYENTHVGDGTSKLTSAISKWAKDTRTIKHVPGSKLMKNVLSSAFGMMRGKDIYTTRRPARRQPFPDVFMPGMISREVTLGVAVDVSGSNIPNLYPALLSLTHIMKTAHIKPRNVKAFSVDVDTSETVFVTNPMEVLDDLGYGGGTRMRPGYEKLGELGQDVSILFTDGYVHDFPKARPDVRPINGKRTKYVTVILLPQKYNPDKVPNVVKEAEKRLKSWGSVIPLYIEGE